MSFLSDGILYVKYYFKIFKLKQLLKRKGLDFTGRIEDANKELRGYEGCYSINGILKKLDINSKDKVLDIGCGKGLFLWYASKFDFEAIDGLEYSQELYNIAKTNVEIIKNPKINVYHEDARTFASYDQYNYFFLNNPFSSSIMQEVLEKILDSKKVNDRPIIIIYQFPFSKNLFLEKGFAIKYEKFPNIILTLN